MEKIEFWKKIALTYPYSTACMHHQMALYLVKNPHLPYSLHKWLNLSNIPKIHLCSTNTLIIPWKKGIFGFLNLKCMAWGCTKWWWNMTKKNNLANVQTYPFFRPFSAFPLWIELWYGGEASQIGNFCTNLHFWSQRSWTFSFTI